MALVQHKHSSSAGLTNTNTLDAPPTAGNLLVAFGAIRSAGVNDIPQDDWYAVPSSIGVGGESLYAYWRVVVSGDPAAHVFDTLQSVHVSEWSIVGGLSGSAVTADTLAATLTAGPVTLAGSAGLAIGAFLSDSHGTAGGNTLVDMDILAPYTHLWYSDVGGVTDPDTGSGLPPAYLVGYQILSASGATTLTASAEIGGFAGGPYAGILMLFDVAAALPEPGWWAC